MIGGTRAEDEQLVFFDGSMQRRWTAVVRAFPGEEVSLISYSADFNEIVVRVEGARDGYQYEIVDLKTMRAQPFAEVYEGLGQPLEVRRVTYKASDGMEIPAYLTLPRGREPRRWRIRATPCCARISAARISAASSWRRASDSGAARCRPIFPTACAISRALGSWIPPVSASREGVTAVTRHWLE